MAVIGFHDVALTRGDQVVLDGVSFTIADGELFAIIGGSGSGKTSLLRLVAGLERADRGHVSFDGVDVTNVEAGDRGAAMVFQEDVLLGFRDVEGNIAFPLEIAGAQADDRKRRVAAESRVWGVDRVLSRKPKTLSAGQRHLTQAARAMVRAPQVFLLDEPLARLDAHDRDRLRREIRTMQQGYGVTTLYVTNDPVEALAVADRVGVLRDGAMRQVGTASELYRRPVDRSVAEFVGPMSFLVGTVGASGHGVDVAGVRLPAWAPALEPRAGAPITVGVRPESVVEAADGVSAVVDFAEYVGDHWVMHGHLGDGAGEVTWNSAEPLAEGATVELSIEAFHIFDDDGTALLHPL